MPSRHCLVRCRLPKFEMAHIVYKSARPFGLSPNIDVACRYESARYVPTGAPILDILSQSQDCMGWEVCCILPRHFSEYPSRWKPFRILVRTNVGPDIICHPLSENFILKQLRYFIGCRREPEPHQ